MEPVAAERRSGDREEFCSLGGHHPRQMQPAPVDEGLHRRVEDSVLQGQR